MNDNAPPAPIAALADAVDDAPITAVASARPQDNRPRDTRSPEQVASDGEREAGDIGRDTTPPDRPTGRKPPRPHGDIWDGCPVKALGVNGGTSYFLDVLGQLRAVGKLERMTIMHLFGHRYAALCHAFPRLDKDGGAKKGEFAGDPAAAAMTQAAAEKGLFDPEGAVRGVGAWTDDDGNLIYHLGNRLIVNGDERAPDSHQGRIYPAYPAIPHPADTLKDHADPTPAILETLATWQWTRPEIDPQLVMGLTGIQMFGGALDWRPAGWFTGGAGSGKSALQRLMLHLHGGEKGLIQSTDPTARGIASLLGQSTMPVSVDELEPGDSGREMAIVETARVASSGGRWLRGSSDQKGSTGQLRSAFLFSSINIPGKLKSQDRQRMIILSLNPFAEGAKAPDMRADTWRKRGAVLKRLIIDRWPSWAERLDRWRQAFAEKGLEGRIGTDNWATVLAMADMMQHSALPTPDTCAGWVAKCAAYVQDSMDEAGTDADEVLTHLLSMPYMLEGGREQYTVAQWIQVAGSLPGAPDGLLNSYADDLDGKNKRAATANAKLAKLMLKVVTDQKGQEPFLFIGDTPVQGLKALFRDSQWQGGAWGQSLRRVKAARFGRATASRTLAGIASRGVEIPLASIPGLAFLPQDREHAYPSPAAQVHVLAPSLTGDDADPEHFA